MEKDLEGTLKEALKEVKDAKRPRTMGEMLPQTIIYLVTGVLIVLKALGMITLSWWWITIFLWLPFAFIFAFIGAMLLVFVISGICFGVVCLFEFFSDRR